jgi:hypothetical protein
MALIVDPDIIVSGNQYELAATPTGTKILTIDFAGSQLFLTKTGALSDDGITLKALYSSLKEIWKNDTTAIRYPFPAVPITDEQMEFIDYSLGNDTTRQLIRTGGWAEKTGSTTNREYAGVVTLGSIGSGDQVYYRQLASDGLPSNIVLTGPVNQAVQIFGDASNGAFDYRGYLTLYVREQAKTYASSSLTDIGVSTMTYQVYRFPLANGTDLKVTEADLTVDAYGVTITWYAVAQSRLIGSTSRNFHVIIDGNNRTAEQIYMAVQSALRKASDVDDGSGTKTGSVTNELLQFVGDTLKTRLDSTGGVYIDNFQTADTNRLTFVDDTGTERTFPFVASLVINFGANLVADADAIYRVFFTDGYGTAGAITVNDNDDNPITGNVGGGNSVQVSFDYDGNNQGGRTPGTEAEITAVAIGLSTGQFVSATTTIQRSTANTVTLTASLERNYQNP